MEDRPHAPPVRRHQEEGLPLEREDLDRLRRPGIEPRSLLVSAPPAPAPEPPRPRRSHHPRPRPSRVRSPLEVAERRAVKSMTEYQTALRRKVAELALKLECVDQAISLLTGETSVDELIVAAKKAATEAR